MFCTITIGNYIFIQGMLETLRDDGKAVVRVGEARFTGVPVTKNAA
ncbi:hypothetical protein [Phaeovulum sp. NW3]|nr:hypothetical protein [Phaeovulum sp. NW3]MCL7465902.1 hypothetical protein [Phaeovulum sp. NW3]